MHVEEDAVEVDVHHPRSPRLAAASLNQLPHNVERRSRRTFYHWPAACWSPIKREEFNMPCPICRCPVVRDVALFANKWIAHQTCMDRHEGLRKNEVRKRRAPDAMATYRAYDRRGISTAAADP